MKEIMNNPNLSWYWLIEMTDIFWSIFFSEEYFGSSFLLLASAPCKKGEDIYFVISSCLAGLFAALDGIHRSASTWKKSNNHRFIDWPWIEIRAQEIFGHIDIKKGVG